MTYWFLNEVGLFVFLCCKVVKWIGDLHGVVYSSLLCVPCPCNDLLLTYSFDSTRGVLPLVYTLHMSSYTKRICIALMYRYELITCLSSAEWVMNTSLQHTEVLNGTMIATMLSSSRIIFVQDLVSSTSTVLSSFSPSLGISVASWPSHAGISLGRTLAPLMKIKPYYMRTNGIVPSFTPVNTSSHPVVFASGWSTCMFYSLHWIGTDPDEEVLSRNDAICTYIKIYLLGCYIYWRQISPLN